MTSILAIGTSDISTLPKGIYDTGKRDYRDIFDIVTFDKWLNAELMLVHRVASEDELVDIDPWPECWTNRTVRSDGLISFEAWEPTLEERERRAEEVRNALVTQ